MDGLGSDSENNFLLWKKNKTILLLEEKNPNSGVLAFAAASVVNITHFHLGIDLLSVFDNIFCSYNSSSCRYQKTQELATFQPHFLISGDSRQFGLSQRLLGLSRGAAGLQPCTQLLHTSPGLALGSTFPEKARCAVNKLPSFSLGYLCATLFACLKYFSNAFFSTLGLYNINNNHYYHHCF